LIGQIASVVRIPRDGAGVVAAAGFDRADELDGFCGVDRSRPETRDPRRTKTLKN
jgi:hypothetical protein